MRRPCLALLVLAACKKAPATTQPDASIAIEVFPAAVARPFESKVITGTEFAEP